MPFECIIKWNPSCEATPFASEKWPFKRDDLLSGVKINTFMFDIHCQVVFPEGVGLTSGWPLKRGSTVLPKKGENFFLL